MWSESPPSSAKAETWGRERNPLAQSPMGFTRRGGFENLAQAAFADYGAPECFLATHLPQRVAAT
jgi:hypothetical protein